MALKTLLPENGNNGRHFASVSPCVLAGGSCSPHLTGVAAGGGGTCGVTELARSGARGRPGLTDATCMRSAPAGCSLPSPVRRGFALWSLH